MRTLVYVAAAVWLVLVLAASPAVAAPTSSCWVTPAPVVLGQPWTIHAAGLTPMTTYWLKVDQQGFQRGHPIDLLPTDAAGYGELSYLVTDPYPDLVLKSGTGFVRVYPDAAIDPNASGRANCKFLVG